MQPKLPPREVDPVLEVSRWVGGLIAESLTAVRPALTVPQWRVLVLAAAGDCNVSEVAEDLGVHISNATRICHRLVLAGLVERRRAEQDRRHVLLDLTPSGRVVFDKAMDFRRRRIEAALTMMEPEDRLAFARLSTRFVEAAATSRAHAAPS